jgi:DNA polymerase I
VVRSERKRSGGWVREARMILAVHDELLFEALRARAEELSARIRDLMESAAELKVPLTVDIGVGENWKDDKP